MRNFYFIMAVLGGFVLGMGYSSLATQPERESLAICSHDQTLSAARLFCSDTH